jgi:hypothetical protein
MPTIASSTSDSASGSGLAEAGRDDERNSGGGEKRGVGKDMHAQRLGGMLFVTDLQALGGQEPAWTQT